MFIDKKTLSAALGDVYGTAGHLIKIWFALKHMGLGRSAEGVEVDTSNSTPSLTRLFSCGASDGSFYVPFSHTRRYLTMKHDASRSIIQTTIQRWASSGSVVTCDPTSFIDITLSAGNRLTVNTGRRYPFGLGIDESGFALEDGARVNIPIKAFSVWYGRRTEIPAGHDPANYLVGRMLEELNITHEESSLIFVDDEIAITLRPEMMSDNEIFEVCSVYISGDSAPSSEILHEDFTQYTRRVSGMISGLDQPKWMRVSPKSEVDSLLKGGAKALLLYGPPRTGKTHLIDTIVARNADERCTIQIHDGWGYDNLIQGLKPSPEGNWAWESGPLKDAIENGKKFIVLEEINRTAISQALGEVFSLIEDSYRGEHNAIILRDGKRFYIPDDVVFVMTMNTIDKSTEEVDDALMGRVAAVELPPRAEELAEMLAENHVSPDSKQKIADLFSGILVVYPLGHGYFAGLKGELSDYQVIQYYKARVRPVLANYLGELKAADLANIDNLVDELFGS